MGLFVLFLVIAVSAFAHGIGALFRVDPGWKEIEARRNEISAAEDFVFLYRLGAGQVSAATENRALTSLYTDAARKAYCLFTADEGLEGVNNVHALNRRPNEELEVDSALYEAFALLRAFGRRELYLGPVYAAYGDIFYVNDDAFAEELDPWQNQDAAAFYARIAAYARDPDAIDLELLDGNRVRLRVSEEYLRFAEENGIERFLDFSWMKNAFIADFLAESLTEKGYTLGCLSSYDGFVRNLDNSGLSYSLNLFDRREELVFQAATLDYTGPMSFVSLRSYPVSRRDSDRYYTYRDGEIRSMYLDVRDGRCRAAAAQLTAYSPAQGCGRLLMELLPVYISDSFAPGPLAERTGEEIYALWCEDDQICYTAPELNLHGLPESESFAYRAQRYE